MLRRIAFASRYGCFPPSSVSAWLASSNCTKSRLASSPPILVGSLLRLPIGTMANRYQSRTAMAVVMVTSALAAVGLSFVQLYWQALAAAAAIGVAGGSFAVGVGFIANRFVGLRARRVLDWLGLGVAGAALSFIVNDVVDDWRLAAQLEALALLVSALLFLICVRSDSSERATRTQPPVVRLAPLLKIQVLRFSLYYVFVFGGFVALIVWLPPT